MLGLMNGPAAAGNGGLDKRGKLRFQVRIPDSIVETRVGTDSDNETFQLGASIAVRQQAIQRRVA